MPIVRPRALVFGAALFLLSSLPVSAHMDAARVSLSQLFLAADLVAIARIESVAERDFKGENGPTVYEVVVARVASRYKGEAPATIEFFQDGHGHAYYRPGDTAALFLQALGPEHALHGIGQSGGIRYVSHQVTNTAHRLTAADVADYDWVLRAYGALPAAAAMEPELQTLKIKQILLRMLSADSPDMVESGLLDWNNSGRVIELDAQDVALIVSLTHDPARPMNLRLALLRTLTRRGMANAGDWLYLFDQDDSSNLQLVLKATRGYENRQFSPAIVSLLKHPSGDVVEDATRALGHPVYAGAEVSLVPLLYGDNLRLSYAAIAALIGISSREAMQILGDAEGDHSNVKVRRMVAARLAVIG